MMLNKESCFISVVMYLHNDVNYINNFLDKVYNNLQSKFEKMEFICVNDASTDASVEVIKKYFENNSSITLNIINFGYYQGVENSMLAGVDLSIGDFVYEFDNISQCYYDDSVITSVYQKMLEGFDVVSACPMNSLKFTSKLFYKLFNSYSENNNKIMSNSFSILSRRAINRIHSLSGNILYRKVLYAKCGLKNYNLMFKKNSLKNNKKDKRIEKYRATLATNSLIMYTNIAYKISAYLSLIMILSCIFMGGYTSYFFFIEHTTIEGWTTTMLFLSFGFLGFFLISTIVIKYLSLILNVLITKKKYVIESIDKISK